MEKIRLSKLMSERGICSRREADAFIERGFVYVDGERVDVLGTKVDPDCEVVLDETQLASHLFGERRYAEVLIAEEPYNQDENWLIIDVGTNAVRLEIARALPGGSLETLHQERDPIRPGEGVFLSGRMPAEVEERLVATLRRYAALCRRHKARVRAVATSAMREAKNGPDVVRRVRAATGLELEVISGREEARLICAGVLRGRAPTAPALLVDIGGGSTEVATARGEAPTDLWSVPLGAVRLTQIFGTRGRVSPQRLAALRAFAAEAFQEAQGMAVEAAAREELFAGARLLVLPSFDEGFGLPVLEAMAARKPVVATAHGGALEMVLHSETGLLATVFTLPQLVEERVYLVVPPEARSWAESAGLEIPPATYDAIQPPQINPNVTSIPDAVTVRFRIYPVEATNIVGVYQYPPGEGFIVRTDGFFGDSWRNSYTMPWQPNTSNKSSA